jgi:molybdopterin-binding protein
MLGDQEAVVVAIEPVSIHGSQHVDLTIRLADGREITSRIGRESVPDDVQEGDEVRARLVMGQVVEILGRAG